MFAVRQRVAGRRERMQHHEAGGPRHHQRGSRGTNGCARHMRTNGGVFSRQTTNATGHQVGPLKTDSWFGSIDVRPRETENRGGQGERISRSSGVIRSDLRLVGQVIGQTPDSWQPEEDAGQGTQREEAQWIAAAHVLRLVGKHGHQFIGC